MKYARLKYEEILRDLVFTRTGWEALGYNLSATRFGAYERHLIRLIELGSEGRVKLSADEMGQVYLLGQEISDLLFASKIALTKEHLHHSLRIGEIFRGPDFALNENDGGNNQSRNTLFELYIAARIEAAGFHAEFGGDTDVTIKHEGFQLAIEAKRPQNQKKAETHIRCAAKQLLKRSKEPDEIRIIAICVGKMLSGGKQMIVSPTLYDFNEKLFQLAHEFQKSTHQYWQKKHIDGILIRVGVPGIIESDQIHCSANPMTLFTGHRISENKAIALRSFIAKLEESLDGKIIE